MADTGTQLLLNNIAQVIGGTVSAKDAHFFSGDLAGDSTGIAGIKGCYSNIPLGIQTTPVGIVYVDMFDVQIAFQGEELNTDTIRLLILIAPDEHRSRLSGTATPFRDSVMTAIRANMTFLSTPNVLGPTRISGKAGVHEWGGIPYIAWDFTLRIERMFHPIYTG